MLVHPMNQPNIKKILSNKSYPLYRNTYFSFKPGSTVQVASTLYKIQLLNRYHSIEMSDVMVFNNKKPATYKELSLLLLAISQLSTTTKEQPEIFTIENGIEKTLPSNANQYLQEISKTSSLFLKIKIGKNKTPFCFSITEGDNRIQITTRLYHPDDISSSNILDLLKSRINKQIRIIELSLKYNRKPHFPHISKL